MMNGIGGSGDFTRNAYLVSHVDHSEHSVQAIATEWGVADLWGLAPRERARAIIEKCAHPDDREPLHSYMRLAESSYSPHRLRAAFAFHQQYEDAGDMRDVRLD